MRHGPGRSGRVRSGGTQEDRERLCTIFFETSGASYQNSSWNIATATYLLSLAFTIMKLGNPVKCLTGQKDRDQPHQDARDSRVQFGGVHDQSRN